MLFYHGTTEENFKDITNEGILFGKRGTYSRCTYLATDIKEAKCYGNYILEVNYDPLINPNENNYIDGCWQLRIYEPIPISNIKLIQVIDKTS